ARARSRSTSRRCRRPSRKAPVCREPARGLAVAAVSARTDSTFASGEAEPPTYPLYVAKIRVLVVDDEPQILRALKATLLGAGYEVATAGSGEEALRLAAVQPPEAVVLDLVLPDRLGTEVARELRTWSKVPILVLSAVGEESEKVAALDAGA